MWPTFGLSVFKKRGKHGFPIPQKHLPLIMSSSVSMWLYGSLGCSPLLPPGPGGIAGGPPGLRPFAQLAVTTRSVRSDGGSMAMSERKAVLD